MRVSRIYCEQDLQKALQTTAPFSLGERNTHYLLNVLRVKHNDALTLFDGSGQDFVARVVEVSRRSLSVVIESVTDQNYRESPLSTLLALGISKGERMDFAVQKAIELGVSTLQPLVTERVMVDKKADRLQKKVDHLQAVAISACEQSGRSTVPAVRPVATLREWLANLTASDECLNLTFKVGGEPLSSLVKSEARLEQVRLLVGPEGGLSESEIQLAEQFGFKAAGMGPRILRTETAPLVALTLLQAAWGDLR